MSVSNLKVVAEATLQGFDKVVGKLANFKDKVMGFGGALRKAALGSANPINHTGRDNFTKANQDRLHKLEQTRKVMSSTTGTMRTLVTSFAALGAMFGADRIVGGIVEIGQAMFDTDRAARHMGNSTEGLIAFQYGARRIGEDSQEASQALYNLYENFQLAANGGKIAQRAFAGIFDKEKINNLSLIGADPTNVFNQAGDAIAKMDDLQSRIAAVRRLTKSHESAQAMLGLVEASRTPSTNPNLGKGMANLGAFAIEKGFAVRSEDVAILRETARKFEDAASIFKGAWIQIAIGLAPLAKMAADFVTRQADGKSVETMGKDFGAWLITSFEYLHNLFLSFDVGLTQALNFFATGVVKSFAEAVRSFMTAVNSMNPGKDMDTRSINKLISDVDLAGQGRQRYADMREDQKYKGLNGKTDWRSMLDGNKLAMQIGGAFGAPAFNLPASKAQKTLAQQKPLFDAADQLKPTLLSPYELYQEQIENFDKMLSVEALKMPEYGKAVNQALTSFENAMHLTNIALPSIAKFNTGAAESAVAKSRNEYELKGNDMSPQKRMERAQLTGNEILKRIEDHAKATADAAKTRKAW